jgi:hypothetical protein
MGAEGEYANTGPCSCKTKRETRPSSLTVQKMRIDENYGVYACMCATVLAASVETVLRHLLLILCPPGQIRISICFGVAVRCGRSTQ